MTDALDQALSRARDAIAGAHRAVVLTGSGVSAESKIPTFRDAHESESGGADAGDDTMRALWAEFDPQTLATPEAYASDPEMVTRWYDWRRLKCLQAEPNPGHTALADMQRRADSAGRSFTLITQNVDGLHQRAGSSGVVELHGSITAWRGVNSGRPYPEAGPLPDGPFTEYPPRFADGETARPCVVWFGETLPEHALTAAEAALASCELFLSVGTSSQVYPAAGMIHTARSAGATTIEINPDATPISGMIDIPLRGRSGEILPKLLG